MSATKVPVAQAVLYNDTCPVCRREIDHYRGVAERHGTSMRFEPLDRAEAWGLSRDDAAKRLHVRTEDGILSGYDAFLAIWRGLPGWGRLAGLGGLPGLRTALSWAYDRVAAPILYGRHRRRMRRAACSPSSTSSTPRS
ncbi:DUF393 domain-containing protein [Jannaschia sp. LMIT008]|uniref:thiol-disulfide oxidoreductase DCC family protein n=1 Tax=Jannaschia maritima TaxID=3032585 RepID=UPI0028111151|nr:DUF393 domain-containing protein [Jannaschia sp. LMIT008]